ncbi:DUF3172 domain-containing protein [Oscillatoria sp. FACHB-1407]|uniref:DUF3172 domain-containing protein n=1 Tax=Oscillatoria sp. FACHB-1407 TaxID=2692847 RepID=UPI001685E9D4|nr:DUF3172 domain-containing protein [Oscillatoria sp. FACHB-1407]MBD2461808.1 DUF3172 domain-containing protein [Oscillatoria sp. FACHB-1407]
MRRRPKAPPRSPSRPPLDRDVERPSNGGGRSPLSSAFNYVNIAIIAAVFILGIGIGIAFSSTASFSPENVASREVIDRSAPNPELCQQFGASAITMDMRAFVTLNPFSVYVSQPRMEPGCVLRNTNWAVLERKNLINQQQVNQCRQRMNTFAFTGDIEVGTGNPKVDCVYQNDAAQNLFLNQPGFGASPPETDRF